MRDWRFFWEKIWNQKDLRKILGNWDGIISNFKENFLFEKKEKSERFFFKVFIHFFFQVISVFPQILFRCLYIPDIAFKTLGENLKGLSGLKKVDLDFSG